MYITSTGKFVTMKDITSSVYDFEDLIQGNFLYVDKTEYIWQLIRPAKEMYFLWRPRRFGKSLTHSTLKAVFEGKKELFKGLALYDKPYNWKKSPVIHLDMNRWYFSTLEKMEKRFQLMLLEQASLNNAELQISSSDTMFHTLIKTLHDRDGDVVVLLDEYDKPILNFHLNITPEKCSDFLNALEIFYSVIKEKADMLRLVFITGVIRFCHVSLFSDWNNLTDISMDARYATMFGYTQDELEENFGDRISALAGQEDVEAYKRISALAGQEDVEAYKGKINKWYNGYRFHKNAQTVYNPGSLAQFFEKAENSTTTGFQPGRPLF